MFVYQRVNIYLHEISDCHVWWPEAVRAKYRPFRKKNIQSPMPRSLSKRQAACTTICHAFKDTAFLKKKCSIQSKNVISHFLKKNLRFIYCSLSLRNVFFEEAVPCFPLDFSCWRSKDLVSTYPVSLQRHKYHLGKGNFRARNAMCVLDGQGFYPKVQ
jgi:hypothetical protein